MDNSEEFKLMLDEAVKSNPLAFEGFDRTKNVQDQLQVMIESDGLDDLHSKFNIFIDWYNMRVGDYRIRDFSSYDQLWLAAVMKEKYNKMWDGSEWELDK